MEREYRGAERGRKGGGGRRKARWAGESALAGGPGGQGDLCHVDGIKLLRLVPLVAGRMARAAMAASGNKTGRLPRTPLGGGGPSEQARKEDRPHREARPGAPQALSCMAWICSAPVKVVRSRLGPESLAEGSRTDHYLIEEDVRMRLRRFGCR